jgi:hypothetical protein
VDHAIHALIELGADVAVDVESDIDPTNGCVAFKL